MAAPYNPPVKGEEFKVRIALSIADGSGAFKANPTIAAGDFKVDLDGAGLTNLLTTPVVNPSGTVLALVSLAAAEMNADVVTIVGIDQTAPKEWLDFVLSIPTTSA
jgi:hypothetical protein